MLVTQSQRRNFLRLVYTGRATQDARAAYLNDLNVQASASLASGKSLTGSSGSGVTVQYELIAGHKPEIIAALVDWAFEHISASTIEEALAEIPRRGVTTVRDDFTCLRG